MAEVTRVPPAEWLEGRINYDLTTVIGNDGTKYCLPWRMWRSLNAGERVKFTLSPKKYRGKRWVNRVIPLL